MNKPIGIAVCILFSFVLVLGNVYAEDAVIQELQSDVSSTKSKADQNEAAIKNLQGGLPTEREERILGDESEAAARIAGDSALQDKIDAEAAARTAADADLQDQIDNIPSQVTQTYRVTSPMIELRLGNANFIRDTYYLRASAENEGDVSTFVAPINIPDGSEITSVDYYFRDGGVCSYCAEDVPSFSAKLLRFRENIGSDSVTIWTIASFEESGNQGNLIRKESVIVDNIYIDL